jgi:Ca2+-binding RTX toxin-like protein
MTVLEKYYVYASLAQTAYVDLSSAKLNAGESPYDPAIIARVAGADGQQRLPTARADQLFGLGNYVGLDSWTLHSPYYRTSSKTGHSDPASGFAGMLLSHPDYGKVLAIAGTEPGQPAQTAKDLIEADIQQIGLVGIALKQVASLFNYMQELRAANGVTGVVRLEVRESSEPPSDGVKHVSHRVPFGAPRYYWLEAHHDGVGQGRIADGETLTVTGHSLGGHLAAIAVALFPDQFTTAYTFNAPGYDPLSSFLYGAESGDSALALFGEFGTAPLALSSISERVITLEAEDAIPGDDGDGVSGKLTGTPFSPERFITTERVTHDIGHLMDSLALQALFAKLNPDITVELAGQLIEAATNVTGESLELLLEKLTFAITVKRVRLDRTEPSSAMIDGGEFSIRNTYYEQLLALESAVAGLPELRLVALSVDPGEILSLALRDDDVGLGYRFALAELNPFVILGADYTVHADRGDWTLFDPLTGEGALSEAWLADRAAMLGHLIVRNTMDGSATLVDTGRIDNVVYLDAASGQGLNVDRTTNTPTPDMRAKIVFGSDQPELIGGGRLDDRLYGGGGDDTLGGGGGNDRLEGSRGDDRLDGGAGRDTLLGGAGNDTLDGGAGDDHLAGGIGNDVYVIDGSAGHDIVDDTDGGVIKYREHVLSGGKAIGTGAQQWRDEHVTYTLVGDGDTRNLVITVGANTVTVLDWQPGKFGIELEDAEAPAPVETDRAIVGDLAPIDFDSAPGVQVRHDELGNVITDPEKPEPGRADVLWDSDGDDHIVAGDGDDTVRATRGGDDYVEGGGGADVVDARGGNDLVEGGAGADILAGDEGDDRLFADLSISVADALARGENEARSGERGDWLDGGEGRDLAVGGAGDDVLAGGGGSDMLIGGAGDDLLLGDDERNVVERDWSVAREIVPQAGATLYRYSFGQASVEASPNGAGDALYGGAGSDWIMAGAGNDFADGGADDDVIFGEDGDDKLIGGLGNDVISGDSAALPPAVHGHDLLDGGEGDDELFGMGGSDSLFGGAGNDVLQGDGGDENAGNDYLDGEDGDDQLYGGALADTLYGGAGNDVLVGDYADTAADKHGDDFLDGEDGDDVLLGMGGHDTLIGGTGSDLLFGDASDLAGELHGDDFLDGGEGDDELVGGGGADFLSGGDGHDRLFGDDTNLDAEFHGDDTLDGGAGDDVLVGGRGADRLAGGDGDDLIVGEDGQDSAGDDDVLDGGAGHDRLYGDGGNDRLAGGEGNDLLVGGAGDDTLDGGSGNDTLVAGDGADAMAGGAGDDTYVVRAGSGNKRISDTGGDDLLVVQGGSFRQVVLRLGSLLIDTGVPDGEIHLDDFAPDDPFGSGTIERFQFDDGVFTYAELVAKGLDLGGTPQADVIFGTGLADRIDALAADDVVFAGAGDDRLAGGDGRDLVYGEAGDDILDGGAGDDILDGGSGDDRYLVDSAGDVVIEQPDGGVDHVEASVAYTLAEHVENLTLAGAQDLDGTGNALDNLLVGNGGANHLTGLAGDDRLEGGDGDDLLDGGAGEDLMIGGTGDDRYLVDGAGDVVIEQADGGIDHVEASVTYTLTEHVENLTLVGAANLAGSGNALANEIVGNDGDNVLSGGAGDDRLFGGAGKDVLDGGAGADRLEGGAGDDTYVAVDLGDTLVEAADGGIDAVIAAVDYVLGEHFENLTLATSGVGGPPVTGRGNALDNRITGNAAHNRLYGEAGDDVLVGGAGHDLLDGGSGADTLVGGAGDDRYIVDSVADLVIEDGAWPWSGGIDVVEASVSHALAANVEWLELSGDAAIDGTGNALDNLIVGNDAANRLAGGDGHDRLQGRGGDDLLDGGAGDDILDGGSGDDTMYGGSGNDLYFADSERDAVVETAGGGHDTVRSLVSHVLGDHVEVLRLDGWNAIDGSGNALDNLIVGNGADNVLQGLAGNDRLDGGAGADTLIGGTGDDIYDVDDAGDRIVEAAGEGIDWVLGSTSVTLAEHVENLRLVGDYATSAWLPALDGTGNGLANELRGSDGDNRLSGRAGDDRLDGRAGNDELAGDDGNDWLYGGDDAIRSGVDDGYGGSLFGTASLAPNADRLFGGAGADLLDGGSGDDTLDGGDGDDFLFGGHDGWRLGDPDGYGGGYGGQYLSNDDTLDGGAGDDILDGGSGNDVLLGGDGADRLYGGDDGPLNASNDDWLDGGAGLDVMRGGTGDDTYIVDGTTELLAPPPPRTGCDIGSGDDEPVATLRWVSDLVIEAAGEGYDRIYSSVGMVLPEHVEAIELTGTANLDVIGNDAANLIRGNAGDNLLDGRAGADFMAGGAGDDTYYVDDAGDAVLEYAGEGVDTVRAWLDGYRLGATLENLDLAGGVATGFGNELDNRLRGNAAANVLYGGGGNDRIAGAGGDDTLYGGAGDDVYYFGRGGGRDLIVDAAGSDRVVFVGGLAAERMTLAEEGADLVIGFRDGDERVVLAGWHDGGNSVESVEFCDGPRFDRATLAAILANPAPPTGRHGKGNEGVGNGEDPPPPGHDTNWNDGAGTSPGDPGRLGGMPSQADPSDRDSGEATLAGGGRGGPSGAFPLIDLALLDRLRDSLDEPPSPGGERGADFERQWAEMARSLGRLTADGERIPAWLDPAQGADPRGFGAFARGGAMPIGAGGVDPVSLAAGAGLRLERFRGLDEGLRSLGWG